MCQPSTPGCAMPRPRLTVSGAVPSPVPNQPTPPPSPLGSLPGLPSGGRISPSISGRVHLIDSTDASVRFPCWAWLALSRRTALGVPPHPGRGSPPKQCSSRQDAGSDPSESPFHAPAAAAQPPHPPLAPCSPGGGLCSPSSSLPTVPSRPAPRLLSANSEPISLKSPLSGMPALKTPSPGKGTSTPQKSPNSL